MHNYTKRPVDGLIIAHNYENSSHSFQFSDDFFEQNVKSARSSLFPDRENRIPFRFFPLTEEHIYPQACCRKDPAAQSDGRRSDLLRPLSPPQARSRTGGGVLASALRSPLIRSTLRVTLASLLLRLLGLYVNSRITSLMGAEGMGLLQLGMNVEALAVTLGTSGIHFSVTRLVSEELGRGRPQAVRGILRSALFYALCFSCAAALLLILGAEAAAGMIGEARLALSLRCFALGIPFLALNSVLSGYFTAVYRPWKATLSQGAEQLIMTALILVFLPLLPPGRPELGCAAVALSGAGADLCSLLLSYLLYCFEVRGIRGDRSLRGGMRRLMSLSLPLAFSSYARTALSTLQHLLVPRALRRSGETASAALSVYGTVSGMVFPVLTFASVFFNALSELLIPELTRSQVRGDQAGMDRTAGRILSGCLLFSAAAALILFLLGPWLGRKLYRSAEAGMYLRLLSPLVVVMYLDSVVDGMLKGLGLHLSSMFINVLDAGLTLLGVTILLPRFGVRAYISLLYFSECLNFTLSYLRLGVSLP